MEDPTGGASAVADTPAASPPSAESSTPASTTTTVERPTSFAEAMARAAVPATPANPGESKPVGVPETAAAVAQPPQAQTPPTETAPSTEAKGPIPFERHQAALNNARSKTESEVTQRFQQQYAPHVELGQRIQADPVGTVVQLLQELGAHPDHGASVTAAVARMLGSRRGQAQAVEDQEPQADLQASDGTLVFSAEQLAKREAYQRTKLLQEVDQRLQPLQTREESLRVAETERAARADAMTRMGKVVSPFKALPEFEANKEAIGAKTKALLAEGHDPQTALGLAVATVLREVVMPSRAAQSQQQLVAQAVAKSTGSTSAPGAAPSAPAGRPRSFEEGFRRVAV